MLEKINYEAGQTRITAKNLNEIQDSIIENANSINTLDAKNKKQDFYINALYNENTDGRLSIEEEGNDLKLMGSKQGIVEIEKVVGNTLVNRVSEPMRELTLNGDIDTQGTFVTTTEGVDNGLVDVMCEGNTLVNLYENKSKLFDEYFIYDGNERVDLNRFVEGKEYTAIILNSASNYSSFRISTNDIRYDLVPPTIGKIKKFTYIPPADDSINKNDVRCYYYPNNKFSEGDENKIKTLILEGDWTNKEIPPYFEGMKSVGQDDENSHKIETLSRNKNWCQPSDISLYTNSNFSASKNNNNVSITVKNNEYFINFATVYTKIEPNRAYKVRYENTGCLENDAYFDPRVIFTDENKVEIGTPIYGKVNENTFIAPSNAKYFYLQLRCRVGVPLGEGSVNNIQVYLSTENSDYVEPKYNKKEISLNEPLRGITDKIKDRFVKIGGKYFIERNTKKVIIDNNTPLQNSGLEGQETCKKFMIGLEVFSDRYVCNSFDSFVVCDTLPTLIQNERTKDVEFVSPDGWNVNIFFSIKRSKLQGDTIADVKTYLQQNPIELIYKLATPTYEPLEIEPTLNTYNDITHISNNSIIPCNMKVKNTGFSCRALTSGGTYTVVHNGGEGVTSNVDTTDNVVRLSGKGKTVSDVMVLDGTVSKTYGSFEGMQSTFKDKLITQEMVDAGEELAENLGKYRVGVKVRGKNLFDEKSQIKAGNWLQGEYKNGKIHLKNDGSQRCVYLVRAYFEYGKMYCLSYHNLEGSSKYVNLGVLHPMLPNGNVDISTSSTFNCGTRKFDLPSGYYYIRFYTDNLTSEDYYVNYMLEEVELISSNSTQYEPYKEYKTSILLSSPLLKGDEIVWKEDGLYHWHKMGKELFDGSIDESWVKADTNWWGIPLTNCSFSTSINTICDKLIPVSYDNRNTMNSVYCGSENLYTRVVANSLSEYKQWLQANPTTVIYELAEPYYEKISDDKFVSEIPNNATLHIDSIIPCQSVKASYTGKLPSVYKLESDISTIEELNVDMVATSFDMDYRLLEVEWALEDAGITGINLFNILNTNKGVKSMALSRYEQAKIMIIGGAYDKEVLTKQLTRYLEKKIITQQEYDELIALMEAKELVVG